MKQDRRAFLLSAAAMLGAGAGASVGLPLPAQAQPQTGGVAPGKPFKGVELNVLTVVAPQFRAHEARLAAFEELTGIRVKYQYVPFTSIRDKLTAEMVAENGDYDVVSVMDVWAPSLKNLLHPLNDGIRDKGIDMTRYPDAYLRASRNEAGYIGLPIRGHVQLLFYRKDVLADLKLAVPRTWGEVVTVSQAIQTGAGMPGIAMYYGKNAGQNLMVWFDFLWGRGGELLDARNQPVFQSPAGIAATQDYLDLMLKHKVTPAGSVSFNETDAVNSMAQGKCAMLPTWWWRYQGLTDGKSSTLSPEKVGFAPMPGYPGAATPSHTNLWLYGIDRHSKKKTAAMEFLAWLTQPAIEKSLLLDPAQHEIVSVQSANLADPAVNAISQGMHRMAGEVLKNARVLPLIPQWPVISDILDTAISKMALGTIPVKEGLDDAARKVRKLV